MQRFLVKGFRSSFAFRLGTLFIDIRKLNLSTSGLQLCSFAVQHRLSLMAAPQATFCAK